MKWHECGSCWAEFRVVSDSDSKTTFCPFCGADLDESDDDDDDDLEYDED